MKINSKEVTGVFIGKNYVRKIRLGSNLAYSRDYGYEFSQDTTTGEGFYSVIGRGTYTGKKLIYPNTHNDGVHGEHKVTRILSCGVSNDFDNVFTTVVIPENITFMRGRNSSQSGALCGLNYVTEIKFNAIDCIISGLGDVFGDCGRLTSGATLTIGKKVKKIPQLLFRNYYKDYYRVPNVTSIIFEDNSECESIGQYAFGELPFVGKIVIPKSVTTIGLNAFPNSNNFTIYCEASSKPEGWSDYWATGNPNVVWGYTGD